MAAKAAIHAVGSTKESGRFLKKAPQKLFCPGVSGVENIPVSGAKKFCGAFSKATACFPYFYITR